MIVFIEGIDRIGKTTCCEYLARSGYAYMHFGRPEGISSGERAMFQWGTFDRLFKTLHALDPQNPRIVLDRAHIGELVYGPIYRGDSGVPLDYIHKLEDDYPLKNGRLILLDHDDLDVVRARDDGKGFDINKLEHERHLFRQAFAASRMTKAKVDVTRLTIAQMLAEVDWIANGGPLKNQ